MNSRHAIERQWAALIVRTPAARHILLKWLRALNVEGYWVRFEDPQASLIVQAVIDLSHGTTHPTSLDVAAYLAGRDFSMTTDEARQFVDGLIEDLPGDVDTDRLALAILAANDIRVPDYVVSEHLTDPYGKRANIMQARKVRAVR